MCWEVCTICLASPPAPRDEQILTTPENTITYHNALCLSPQNFAQALFSVSLLEWSILHNSSPSLIFVAGIGKGGGGGGGSVHRLTNSGTHILSNLQESSEMNNWRLYLIILKLFPGVCCKGSKDEHELKLEKTGPTFSSSNAMPAKMTKNYFGQCFVTHFSVWYFLHNLTGVFSVYV